jgi:hypothetical protein
VRVDVRVKFGRTMVGCDTRVLGMDAQFTMQLTPCIHVLS